jgi:hypothetical protein
MRTEVINSIGYEAILQARDAIAERISQAHALLAQAQEIAAHNGLGKVCHHHEWKAMAMAEFLAPGGNDKAISITDQSAWNSLLERSNVMDLMSAKRKAEWRTTLAKGEAPPFTQDAIIGTFRSLYEARAEVFETSVVESFEQLHPCYQRNGLTGFGKRIILSNVTDVYAGGLPGHSACDQIDDLLRFMHVLDAKPVPHRHKIREAILKAITAGSARLYEDDYIFIRWFKNGNGHLTFKRDDIVIKMNEMIAKHRANTLPQPRNARTKSHA